MSLTSDTCWTMIEAAARGDVQERERFCARYLPVVERSLTARWHGVRPGTCELSDATQEVVLECLRAGGALENARRTGTGGFRGYLFGVTRNVARRHERRATRRREVQLGSDVELPAERDEDFTRAFDRAWAEAMVREAGERLRRWAEGRSPAARRRVQILALRFAEGMTEPAIATHLGLPLKRVEKDYAAVRGEFRAMLRQVVAWHGVLGEDPDEQCRELLATLTDGRGEAHPGGDPSS